MGTENIITSIYHSCNQLLTILFISHYFESTDRKYVFMKYKLCLIESRYTKDELGGI